MTASLTDQAADKIGPLDGNVVSYALSTASLTIDVLGDPAVPNTGVLPQAVGRIVAIVADTDFGYIWTNNAAKVIDLTATTDGLHPDKVCFRQGAFVMDEHVPLGRYLIVFGSTSGMISLAITSNKTRVSTQANARTS
jgi:hypothetical protein